MSGPAVDGDRLWRSLQEMAAVGRTPSGGVRRIALTPEDVAGRELLLAWAAPLGLTARTDRAGNLFLRREGTTDRPAVAFGSHLDTQPDGGAFDGALGVLAGLEVMRALDAAGVRTAAPLELVVWTDEEGARFEVSCIGSAVHADALTFAEAGALRDADGVTFAEALAGSGVAGTAQVAFDSYFELHIEQGPQLERSGTDIGVVEGIFGIRWLELTLTGRQAHAGTTPMDARRDALLAAARVVELVRGLATTGDPDARATVCVLDAEPNAGSVIPGRTRLMADLRHARAPELDALEQAFRAGAARIAATEGLQHAIKELWTQPVIAFDPSCVELVAQAADAAGWVSRRMLSGAGHDAGYVAAGAPTGMIFVPCRDGVSHHPDEFASPAACAAGADVLLRAVTARAT